MEAQRTAAGGRAALTAGLARRLYSVALRAAIVVRGVRGHVWGGEGSYELFEARFLHRKWYLAYDREETAGGGRPYNTD